jgi:Domain of unknown function (DUF927)
MDTRAFLERVLPSSGGSYYSNYGTSKLQQSAPLATLDDLVNRVLQHGQRKENVYFAVGVYDNSRTSEAARDKKALYLDLDCGVGKGFESKAGAVKGLAQFCKATNFPLPNIVVDSGHGIHCYWTLTTPIPITQWQPMASALKELCAAHNFPADAAITADSARILRVPGTYNCKDASHPIPCRILKADPEDFEAEVLAGRLSVLAPTAAPSALLGTVGEDDLGGNLYGERTYHAGDMIEQCAALRHTRDTGGKGQPGMLWHKIIHLLAFTADGQDYVHPMSSGHDQYSPAHADARFAYSQQRKATVGPTLCKTIEGFLPSKCAGCPFNGHIKTPLVLGKAQDSFLPPGWKMNKEGVFKPIKFDDKGNAIEHVRAIPYMLSDVELYNTAFGNGLQFAAHNGPRRHVALVLGVDLAGDSRELGKNLMMDRIMLTDTELQEFKRIMIPWMRKMEMVRDAKPAPLTGLGWMKASDKVGFANGQLIFMEDGTTSPVSGVDRTLAKEYTPKGELQPWKDAAAAVMADGCPSIQAAILTAFAAPLINFTGVQGVMLSLHSRESGTGKSSALRVAQAVWGDPVRGVNALNDTANSMAKKFGFLNNLPAYWDEVRMREEVRNFVRMVFQLGQGKEKQRLTSSSKMQEMGTWSTITTIATNEPVLDHVDAVANNTNAGRLRVFEVTVPARKLKDPTVPFKLRDLASNYGHVGADYAAWMAKNHKAVDNLVQKLQATVIKDLNATNDERFWVALSAVLMAAAHIANKRGYATIDIAAFKAWLYQQFKLQRQEAGEQYVPLEQRAVDSVIDYADKMRDQFLVVDHATTRAQKNVGQIHVQPPIREFLGLLALKDKVLRVKKASFRSWLYETQKESPSEVIEKLLTLGSKEHKASVSAGIANTVNARVTVLDIDLSHASFAPVLEDYDT